MSAAERPGQTAGSQALEPSRASAPVLLATPRWARDGGVGAHVQASAAALADHGFEVLVLAALVEPGERIPGVSLFESRALFDRGTEMTARLGQAVSRRLSAIHLHQIGDPEIVDFMRTKAPVLLSAHGYPACTSGVYYFRPGQECTRAHGLGCVPNLLARGCGHTRYPKTLPAKYRNATQTLAALRRADHVVSYSSAVDRHLAANGLPRRTVVPYFPTIPPVSASGHADRRRVVFAGRIIRSKGIDVLIRAARDVAAEFVVCGDGERLEKMRTLARNLGIERRIHFKGWLAPEQLALEFASASVVVVPSLWPEPLGGVGIEALAAGRPVIASATGGILDWLEDGVSGLVVAPGDEAGLARALNELLDDPQRQDAMGAAGRSLMATRFTPALHVQALAASYRLARERWLAERERPADTQAKPPGSPAS